MTMLETASIPEDSFGHSQLLDMLEDNSLSNSSHHEPTTMESLAANQSTPEGQSHVKSPVLKVRLSTSRSSLKDFSGVPPAFRIGLDSSLHSEASNPSPMVSERKRSSKLADDYLEKVRIPARIKKEAQVSRISIEGLSMSSSGLMMLEGSNHSKHKKCDNHTSAAKEVLENPQQAPSSPRHEKAPVGSRRSSALADNFLEKVRCPMQNDVIQHLKKVPTLAVVKKLKSRWPPQSTSTTKTTDANPLTSNVQPKLAGRRASSTGVMLLKDCFESGTGFQNSPPLKNKITRKVDIVKSPIPVSRVRNSFEATADQFGLPLWMGEASKACSPRSSAPKDERTPESDIVESAEDALVRDQELQTGREDSPPEPSAVLSNDDDDNSISLEDINFGPEEETKKQAKPPLPSSASDELTKSTIAASTYAEEEESPKERPVSPLEDCSTLSSFSSPFENLRPSYKVRYTGPRILRPGREWEDGLIDTSFPALPRQNSFDSLKEDHRFDSDRPDSNLFFALLPNDRRFDRDNVDASLPRPAPTRRRSDVGFDPDASGMCSMPGLPWRDKRFDPNASADLSLPCFPVHEDRRFQKEASCRQAPRIPNRSGLQPSVWQTRASEPKTAAIDRKWRLKRVWEDKQNVVVDDTEPEYVVAEPQLKAALSSLLGVPESKIRNPEMNEVSPNSDAQHPKHWKVKTVWDRDGDVVKVNDEASVDCEELLGMFEGDYHHPTESIVFDYSADSLGLHTADLEGDHAYEDYETELSQTSSHTEYIDDDGDDDAASFDFDDSLRMDDSFSSEDIDANLHDPEVLKQKLQEVEEEMSSLVLNQNADSDSRDEARKKIMTLQEKLAGYLALLQAGEEKAAHCEEDGKEDKRNGGPCNDEDSLSSNEGDQRDSKLLQKKLHKVERLMQSMIAEKGEKATKRAKYQRLEEKRSQYLQELGQEPTALVDLPQSRAIQSVLEKIDLEVIEEERSLGYLEETRNESLLRKKLRRVEKEMERMTNEKKDKPKSKKKYQRLAEKRVQYLAELGESITDMSGNSVAQHVDKALDVLNGKFRGYDNDNGPLSDSPPWQHSPPRVKIIPAPGDKGVSDEAAQNKTKTRRSKVKIPIAKNYDVVGRWGSPLN